MNLIFYFMVSLRFMRFIDVELHKCYVFLFSTVLIPGCNPVLLIPVDSCFIATLIWLNIHHNWLCNFYHDSFPSAYHCLCYIYKIVTPNHEHLYSFNVIVQ